jgi:hypothetical protein
MELKLQNIYAINYAIQSKKGNWYPELFKVFEEIKDILELDYFLFLEKSQLVPGYITHRYDSRKKGLFLSDSFKHDAHSDFAHIFEEIDISKSGMIQKIFLWPDCLGYFIIGKERYDRNVTNVIANLLSAPIHSAINSRY